jgi:hypothetical protein
MTTARHRVDDLGAPRLPLPVRAFNLVGGPLADRLATLDEGELCAAARRRTGVYDLGPDHFRTPLRVLLGALRAEADLSILGRVLTGQLLTGLLVTRLRLTQLLDEHPEIFEEEIRAPIVVLGLPRTGTSHLHGLLAQDPRLRSLPYWESLEPIPEPGRRSTVARLDPRRRRCEQVLRFQHWVMPLFPAMHEMTADACHEEIQLLAVDFSTMLFEASYRIPSYRDWYAASDQTEAYRTLRVLLQALQWLRGPKRWVLKSPQHLEQLGPLLRVFPDARIVQTHRDPVRVTASMCTMATYGLRMNSAHIDPVASGHYWAARVERMLRKSVDDRRLVPAAQILDVRFDEFMADELGTVERVYAFAGQPFDDTARRATAAYLDAHRPGRHGTVVYRLDDFLLDADERRDALRFYQERFGVPDESPSQGP